MKKAILGFLALGLPIAALAANGEREFEHGQLGINARTFESDLRAGDARKMEPTVSFEIARSRDFLADRSAESGRRSVIVTPRTLRDPHVAAAGGTHSAVAAPEIDSTSAVTGLTLLLGGMAVLRGRKSRAV